jgi:murein DD-endopeptidase MepM/ murein hydrolase activator NlpD
VKSIAWFSLLLLGFSACLPASAAPAATATADPTESPSPTSLPPPLATFPPLPTATASPVSSPTATSPPYTYIFPVQPANLTGFTQGGHPYGAIDIFIQADMEGCCRFVAPTSGVVDFVQAEDLWDPFNDDPALRGGISVALIGDDGVRYYGSHLYALDAAIRPGLRVTAGQFLGWVGMSGNAAGTLPHLHFGISHPTYPEDWQTRRGEIDPYPYLLLWLEGQNVTPDLSLLTPTP